MLYQQPYTTKDLKAEKVKQFICKIYLAHFLSKSQNPLVTMDTLILE
jgi:hypothetical protein